MRPSRPARRRPPEPLVTPVLPPGEEIELPGRGTVLVRHWPGPTDRRTARRLPPLVLLHGWTVTADLNWFRLYEPLGVRHEYAAFDQRGHGRGLRPESFTLEDCADDVIALADVMGWPQVVPVGYSMGGTIAQLVAHRHPDRVAGLVLCSTAAVFSETRQDQLFFEGLLGITVRALKAAPPFLRQRVPGRLKSPDRYSPIADWINDETSRHDAALIAEAGRAVGRFRSDGWLPSLDVPTAVVVTTEDTVVAPTRQRQLAASIPGATVHAVALDHQAAVGSPAAYFPAVDAALASVASRQPLRVRRGRKPPRGRTFTASTPSEAAPFDQDDEHVQRLMVTGRVQNVGFRQSMQRRAQELGLRGWVRNRHDGRVEAVVAGAREKVDELVHWARQGPPLAQVTNLRAQRAEHRDLSSDLADDFEVRASE